MNSRTKGGEANEVERAEGGAAYSKKLAKEKKRSSPKPPESPNDNKKPH